MLKATAVSPDALIEEAKVADGRLVAAWQGIKTNVRLFGEACKWIQEKELHKYISKPGTKKGYMTFGEYIASRTGGEASRSTIFNALNIHSLTQGPGALPAAVVDEMPRSNQLRLAKVRKKLGPESLTKDLVDRAKREPVNKFAIRQY